MLFSLYSRSHDELTSVTLRKKAHKKRILYLGDAKHNYSEKIHISYSLRRFCDSLNLRDYFM